jgi:hypothetical protein
MDGKLDSKRHLGHTICIFQDNHNADFEVGHGAMCGYRYVVQTMNETL